jgi:hypothetical protein
LIFISYICDMFEKKPDIIAWDEERGYFSKDLTYGTNVGAPAIKLDDVIGWREREVVNVNHQFKTKYEELKKAYEDLVDQYNWNNLIYNSVEYNFLPVVGHTYYLYERDNGELFLSLIEPGNWNKKYIGGFTLDSFNKWVKI